MVANAVPSTLVLLVDGKTVEVTTANSRNEQIADALKDDEEFKSFAKNPAEFAQRFGLKIDPEVSDLLSQNIGAAGSLKDLKPGSSDAPAAVLWAVAIGAYSIAGSKIAVAALEQ